MTPDAPAAPELITVDGLRRRAAPVTALDAYAVLSATEVFGRKTVRADDAYLEGHYPDVTVYPGMFLVESVQEAVLRLLGATRGSGASAEPASIDSIRFTAAFAPGDVIDVHCACRPVSKDVLAVTAQCLKGGSKAARIKMSFRVSPAEDTASGGSHA
ncbi:hypothetical protein ABT072_00930 [Streptomyces sp. NPDC002589]|uniref:hypothetical protein n=1 Tax=Streptomyces sp. NPDC002589 TaxID=3154420 RepID=UPI0033283E76